MIQNTAYTATGPHRSNPQGENFSLPGWEVLHLPQADSTNAEARRYLARGHAGQCAIIADSQSAGECRRDRVWESAPELGLWATFILPVTVPLERLAQSALVLAVAVREAVAFACDLELAAKWPNDLLYEGKKCCGLLVETGPIAENGAPTPLILGVGINIGHAERDFPDYLRDTATSLRIASSGRRFSREAVFYAVAAEIEHWFALWQRAGFAPVREAWLRSNCTIGREIILPEGYGCSRATAHDLDETGALLALTDTGATLRIDSGEVLLADTTTVTTQLRSE